MIALQKEIIYFGQSCLLACDGKCNKAWGHNARPKIFLSIADGSELNSIHDWEKTYKLEEDGLMDPDDYYYPPDQELDEAPEDPGTYEGGCGKPRRTKDLLNKWCARECERSDIANPNRGEAIRLRDFSRRLYNMKDRQEKYDSEIG